MIVSKYYRGDMCKPDREYVEAETYDEVLRRLQHKNMNQVELTKDEARALVSFMNNVLLDEIKNSDCINSIEGLRNIMTGYEKLCWHLKTWGSEWIKTLNVE